MFCYLSLLIVLLIALFWICLILISWIYRCEKYKYEGPTAFLLLFFPSLMEFVRVTNCNFRFYYWILWSPTIVAKILKAGSWEVPMWFYNYTWCYLSLRENEEGDRKSVTLLLVWQIALYVWDIRWKWYKQQ